MSDTLEGWCYGGPWDGKQHASKKNRVRIYVPRSLVLLMPDEDYVPNADVDIHMGYYEFDDGAWRWHSGDD